MDLPRDSSDIQIALSCPACNGNGGFGVRKEGRTSSSFGKCPFDPCSTCSGTGWTLKRPADLSSMELGRLSQRLPLLLELPNAPVGSVRPAIAKVEGPPTQNSTEESK